MRLKRIFILMISIIVLITLIPKNVLAAGQRTFDSSVDYTYTWESGIYKKEIEKDTYVTLSNMRSNIVVYEETDEDNVEIEPSVGYAYYMAKSYDLDDPDMQSVIAMSDQWGNDSNMKTKGSTQSMDGDGYLYMRAKQYGDVYYGILQDAIKNNKNVLRIKDEESVNKNLKVFVDQDAGTYTVGPYKLELNVTKNQYTDEASKILYNELNESGNTFYKTENAFARTNPITGINGTEVRFVDKNGKKITFPNFVPDQEQEFYIRFKPNNDGAIIETGNPIINTSYLTKFTAKKLVTGKPIEVKFGDASEKSSSISMKVASLNNSKLNTFEDQYDETKIVEQTESTLKKREYGASQTTSSNDLLKSLVNAMQLFRNSDSNIQSEGIRKVGIDASTYPESKKNAEQANKNKKQEVKQNNSNSLMESLHNTYGTYDNYVRTMKKYAPDVELYSEEEWYENDIKEHNNTQINNSTNLNNDSSQINTIEAGKNAADVYETVSRNKSMLDYVYDYKNEGGSYETVETGDNYFILKRGLGSYEKWEISDNGIVVTSWKGDGFKDENRTTSTWKYDGIEKKWVRWVDGEIQNDDSTFKEIVNNWQNLGGTEYNSTKRGNTQAQKQAQTQAQTQTQTQTSNQLTKREAGKYSWLNYTGSDGIIKRLTIPGKDNMTAAEAERFREILERDPPTRADMLAQDKVEGSDFIVLNFDGNGGDTAGVSATYDIQAEQQGDPASGGIYNATPTEKKDPIKNEKGEKVGEEDNSYYASMNFQAKAVYVVHSTCTITSVTLNGRAYPVSKTIEREFIVEIEYSGSVSGGPEYKVKEGGFEKLKKKAEEKIKAYFAGLSPNQVADQSPTGPGYEEAFTPVDLGISIGGGSGGGSSGGGSGGGSSGGGSSGGGSSGGSSSGGSSLGNNGSSSGNSEEDEGVLNDIAKYVRIEGNQDGVDVTWSDGTPDGRGIGTGKNMLGEFNLPGAIINMQVGGTIWNETKETDGKKNEGENILAGVQVQLVESSTNEIVATTTTDSKGKYRFFGQIGNGVALINGLKKYYVVYTYNGQTYEATYYKEDLTGNYSNAMEIEREQYNRKFENIYSDQSNYYIDNAQRKSYAKNQKIENDKGQYVDFEGRALTYDDVYTEFLKETLLSDAGEPSDEDYNKVWDRSITYADVINNSLKTWLSKKGINAEYEFIKNHINDTFIQATTKQHNNTYNYDVLYTGYNRFVIKDIDANSAPYNEKKTPTIQIDEGEVYTYLYSINSDQSRNVNFGLYTRGENDLALQKDVYKTTLVINGKKEVYTYDKKAGEIDNFWDTVNRTSSNLYNTQNGAEGSYIREIRKSDYLFNGNDAYGNNSVNNMDNNVKNLQAFVTYRIAVKNQGDYDTKINEIVDYYDSDTYEFDGQLTGNQYSIKSRMYANEEEKMRGQEDSNYVYSYVGKDIGVDNEGKITHGTKQSDLTVITQGINKEETETITKEGCNYKTLYLTGIKGESGNEKIAPGETAYVYLTYKVKNDPTTNRIILDQRLSGEGVGTEKIGKRGIAEINSYATYYHEDTKIPDIFMEENAVNVDEVNNNMIAGTIDRDSNPGSLKSIDLDQNGNIITDNNSNSVVDRQQDGRDKSPNIKLIIDQNEDENRIRRFNGAVFEDERNTQSEKAVIGDGKENKETRVDGVTLQLVELVKNVDNDGVFNGTYSGEKVWGNYTYKDNVNGTKTLPRYASGADKSNVIISGAGLLEVKPDELTANNGEYSFKSIPAGDFYIRFIYGDTAETAMIDDSKWDERIKELEEKANLSYAESTELERLKNIKEVNSLVPSVDDYEGKALSGRNAKSYNGQDYKSTIYHAGIAQIGEYGKYYDINGYGDYNNQNAYIVDDLNIDVNGMGTKPDVVYSNPGVDKSKLYYYNINVGDSNPTVSDAKDVFDIRKNVDKWSRGANGNTLMNNRAEVMASFEKSVTYKPEDNQLPAIKELMENTYMVSQTGIINTEIERTTQGLDVKDEKYGEKQKYSVDHINLGLVERPKAQLKLNKEIDNFMYINSDKGVAFNVSNNQSVNNLSFSKHEQHEVIFENSLVNNLRKIESASSNKFAYRTQKAPERLQLYVDYELMNPAKVQVIYKYFVENVGEVDYAGKDKNESPLFYYMGVPADDDIVSTTNAVQIVDYITNSLVYSVSEQDKDTQWEQTRIDKDNSANSSKFSLIESSSVNSKGEVITTLGERTKEIIDTRDYINRNYLPEISTYNTILTTRKLGINEGLLPTVAESGTSKLETSLTLTQDITSSNLENNLTYNNLTEIIETSNTLGRRCVYSVPGNQRMADQSLGKDAAEDQITRVEWVEPGEIDADSAQTIVILPPTGEVNYTVYVIIGIIVVAIVGAGAILIKKFAIRK